MSMAARPTVDERERAIFAYLRNLETPESGATASRIWEDVSGRLGDDVTRQAYYKLLARLVASHRLEIIDDGSSEGGRRYRVSQFLNTETALTLDDVYEILEDLEPTDAIARVIDAREYFEERRSDTLRLAAVALLEEDPRDLVIRFLRQRYDELRHDLALMASDELRDRDLEARVAGQVRDLQLMAYRYLGLSRKAIDVSPELSAGRGELRMDDDELRAQVSRRVFGSHAIEPVDVNAVSDIEEWNRISVAGTDGSTHGNVLQLATAAPFTDDVGSQVVTFNNSVAFVQAAPRAGRGLDSPYYSVPMSRSAIDDRDNRGMVLAPFMFRYLSESEYEHMAKCATDVVQWRADEAVFLGKARALGSGALLPRPTVHFRDGTITPQEREYGHYRRWNEYGDMVREGITRSRVILSGIMTSSAPSVFVGAVKSTQARLFSSILNWYIAYGSAERLGSPIDPAWDMTRAAHIADNEAMSFLLSTLNDRRELGTYFVTFQVARPFHSLTEYFRQPPDDDPSYWARFFTEKRDREQRAYDRGEEPELPYLASVPEVADENFVFMCTHADYVSFYIGHTGGEPPPVAPRYEFMEALRRLESGAVTERVERNVRLIAAALDRTRFAADREHNYLSRKTLVKIIPFVVFEAHEKCKALGRQLEAELRSIVIANLQGMRRARHLKPSEVEFLPLSVRRFVERYAQARDDDRQAKRELER